MQYIVIYKIRICIYIYICICINHVYIYIYISYRVYIYYIMYMYIERERYPSPFPIFPETSATGPAPNLSFRGEFIVVCASPMKLSRFSCSSEPSFETMENLWKKTCTYPTIQPYGKSPLDFSKRWTSPRKTSSPAWL